MSKPIDQEREALPLFTCAGKGGEYAKLGYAKPAGALKTIQGDSGVIVYRCMETGQLYFRDPRDFNQRMQALSVMEPFSLGGDIIRQRTTADASVQPAGGAVPEGWMLVERSIWTEGQVDSAAKSVEIVQGIPGATARDIAMAAMDAAQCKAPDVSLSDFSEAAPHPVSGEPKPRPTGLSRGWNLTRQVDGFVIGHSSEEPSEKSKAQALLDGRVYVPFLTAASAQPAEQDVAGLAEAVRDYLSAVHEQLPNPLKVTAAMLQMKKALAAHRAQQGEQP